MIRIFFILTTVFVLGAGMMHSSKRLFRFIEFRNTNDSALINWGTQWQVDSLYMNIDTSYGFYPIDKNTVFLAGSFQNSAFTMQSFVLKTTDGGISWREVMNPLQSIHIEKILFINPTEGYLVGDWMTESTGEELILYKTTDGGASWKKLSPFKKPHYTCVCEDLTATKKELTLTLDCLGGTPIDGAYVFTSSGKFKTWKEKSFVKYDSYMDRLALITSAAHTTAFDGSKWSVINVQSHRLFMLRQHENEWDTISRIPKVYHWNSGILTYK